MYNSKHKDFMYNSKHKDFIKVIKKTISLGLIIFIVKTLINFIDV